MAAQGGGAANDAALLNPADYLEPIEDRDCSVELVLPQLRVLRKRQRIEEEEDDEPRVVVIEAASTLLKSASQKFR